MSSASGLDTGDYGIQLSAQEPGGQHGPHFDRRTMNVVAGGSVMKCGRRDVDGGTGSRQLPESVLDASLMRPALQMLIESLKDYRC